MNIESKLKELKINLPKGPSPVGSYVAYKKINDIIYISGQLPIDEKGELLKGKLGFDINLEDAQKGSLRLKEFADITLKKEPYPVANIDSYERSDKRPIVHWITKENSLEGTLLSTSNDEIQTVQGRIEKHNFAPGTIVQLERIGYACIKENGSFILCHESFDE